MRGGIHYLTEPSGLVHMMWEEDLFKKAEARTLCGRRLAEGDLLGKKARTHIGYCALCQAQVRQS